MEPPSQPNTGTANNYGIHHIKLDESSHVILVPNFFSPGESSAFLNDLQKNIPWKNLNDSFLVQPRLVCWFSDPGCSYVYSSTSLAPEANWNESILRIKEKLSLNIDSILATQSPDIRTGSRTYFNSVLVNLYRSGADYVRWHSDNEPCFGTNPIIASISFGATRKFSLKPIRAREEEEEEEATGSASAPQNLELTSGSLLIMCGKTQERWLHCVPKAKGIEESRINLTFRKYIM